MLSPGQTSTTFHTTSYNFDVLWNVALVWPPRCIVFYRVVSCCMKFDRDQTFHQTNVVRYNISFVFRNIVWCCTRLATPSNFVVLCCTRACAAEIIFSPHSFVDFVFEDMFNRVARNVVIVWPPLSWTWLNNIQQCATNVVYYCLSTRTIWAILQFDWFPRRILSANITFRSVMLHSQGR